MQQGGGKSQNFSQENALRDERGGRKSPNFYHNRELSGEVSKKESKALEKPFTSLILPWQPWLFCFTMWTHSKPLCILQKPKWLHTVPLGLPVLGQAENLWCPKVQGAMTGVLGVWTSITWVCPISAKVRSALVGICFHQFFHLSCLCFKTVNTSETDFSMIPLFALLPEIHFFWHMQNDCKAACSPEAVSVLNRAT